MTESPNPEPTGAPPPPPEASAPRADRAVEAGRGALFIGVAKVFFMLSAFVQKVLLLRIVGPAEFGIFSVVNAAVSVVNNATVQGTIQSVSKFTAEKDEQAEAVKRAGLRLQLLVGGALGIGFFLAAPLIAAKYNDPGFARWIRLVAPIPFLYSLYAVFVGSANGQRRFRLQASFDIGYSSIKTLLLLGGAALFGVGGAIGGFVGAAIAILVVAAVVMGLPKPGAESFPMRRLVSFMGGIVAYTFLINLSLQYDLLLFRWFVAQVTEAKEANALAGFYETARNFALLPNSALLVITFVIFPLVSRSTFQEDQAATRAYVTQTLRYALILAVAMAAVLWARPRGLLELVYGEAGAGGAAALPILVVGVVALSLLGIASAMINASGRPRVTIALVSSTLIVGTACAFALVPRQSPGPAMLRAAALAAAIGMATGFGGALFYLRARFAANPPLATVLRVAGAAALAVGVGRAVPGTGALSTLGSLALAGIVYLVVLVLAREFGPADRDKFRKILSRR